MIFAIEHRLGVPLVEARTERSAIKKARRYFGEQAEPIVLAKDQAYSIEWAKSFGAGIISCALLCTLLVMDSYAAEVCVEKGEFSSAMQRWQIDQKKIKVHEQKDVTQAQMLKEKDAHIADQDKQLTACEKYKAAAEPLIDALEKRTQELEQAEKDHEFSVWMERGKGFAVGVGLGVLYLIVK